MDVNFADAGEGVVGGALDVADDLRADRAAGACQRHGHVDVVLVGHFDVVDQAEVDDIHHQFGILDMGPDFGSNLVGRG